MSALPSLHGTRLASPAAAQIDLHRRLRQEGLNPVTIRAGLALAASVLARSRGLHAYPTQIRAAALMLEGHLVEMATGEGKTVAAALAAAVAALAGRAVHVLTANDYLVGRDQSAFADYFAALGLDSAVVLAGQGRAQRVSAYRAAIVYTTARELVFDYLNDHLRLRGERAPQVLAARRLAGTDESDVGPTVPALDLALIDEADSILLDEACTPLILSARGPAIDLASFERALAVADGLQIGRDFSLDERARMAALTEAGQTAVAIAVDGAEGLLRPARRAFELVEAGLCARHLFRSGRDYATGPEGLLLIDEVTGRVAGGRRWQGLLHTMIELKEGLTPEPPLVTAAQMTYQRFFARYQHLGGMSGTLGEARRELRATYGSPVRKVPLAKPARRLWWGERMMVSAPAKWQAVLARVRELQGLGRPVLIGTDSVSASLALSAVLGAAGVAHEVLNAVQNADEAAVIARAGQAGAVTVATNIAGRGTDILLDARARAAGGLHVILSMRNRSRRIDRQLAGRSARHGDPGSAESVLALDDGLMVDHWPAWLRRLAARSAGPAAGRGSTGPAQPAEIGPLWTRWLAIGAQRRAEALDRARRARLRAVEARGTERFAWSGGIE